MTTTWEYAVLKTINALHGESDLQSIYKNIDRFIDMSDYQERETKWGGRPAFQHTVRSTASTLCRHGYLRRVDRGVYAITQKGKDAINT